MEIANPMQLVKVSTLPTACLGALLAVSVENWGESPAAVSPQIANHNKNQHSGADINQGAKRQQKPLMLN
jgi:hypothetical protein